MNDLTVRYMEREPVIFATGEELTGEQAAAAIEECKRRNIGAMFLPQPSGKVIVFRCAGETGGQDAGWIATLMKRRPIAGEDDWSSK